MSDRKIDDRRFRFGDNWLDFARDLSADQVVEAEKSLRDLLGRSDLAGIRFVDIGSGSGLFSLAARRLGASVHSFDYDMDSVLCTRRMRDRHFPGDRDWTIEQGSVLDPDYVRGLGTFDVVYSWGVLHHTGNMHAALDAAAGLVGSSGLFAFALYRRTRMCGFWRWEKRWYAGATPRTQLRIRSVYVALLRLRFAALGGDFRSYIENYRSKRGMDFEHDVHDWLGGYPYESILGSEVDAQMQRLDFMCVHSTPTPMTIGLFGSGCDEYVYRRVG